MTSKLFQQATARERRSTRSRYNASPMQRLARDVGRAIKGTTGRSNMRAMMTGLLRPEVKSLLATLEKGGAVHYALHRDQESKKAMDKLLGHLGPVGEMIRSVVTRGSGDFTTDSLDAAVNMVRAFGGEVMVRPGHPGYTRGLAAAKQLLEEAGYDVTKRPETPAEQRTTDSPRYVDSRGQPADWLYEAENRVSSSSVYSYAFSQETETYGTVYVTFLAWTPGQDRSSDAAGATYAYHAVPVQKYMAFRRAAERSAGTAVWDYLRIRGTVHAHQHPYELVGGVPVQDSGPYIPRKATAEGFFRRSIQRQGRGRGQVLRSQLPSREFLPDRGTPNRGAPNRGRP